MDFKELTSLLRWAQEVGVLPLVWVIVILAVIQRFPWIKKVFTLASPSMQKKEEFAQYVVRSDCHAAMDRIDTEFTLMHEKINDANQSIGEMRGYLEGKLGR